VNEEKKASSGPEQLRERSKRFAIRIIRLFRVLKQPEEARVIGRQLLRSGTSIAANYRAVCRARSRAEFVSKMGVVVEEADETVFWLELLVESEILPKTRLAPLIDEATQLVSIFSASLKTARPARRF
jgi:four helix bundle protein